MTTGLRVVAQTVCTILSIVGRSVLWLTRMALKVLMFPFVATLKCGWIIYYDFPTFALAVAAVWSSLALTRLPIWMSHATPRMCSVNMHTSHIDNIYNKIPGEVRRAVATAFVMDRCTSRYSCVLLYVFMRDVCDALHKDRNPLEFRIGFTTAQLHRLRELSAGYKEVGFDGVCSEEFVREFCGERTTTYIVRRLYDCVYRDLAYLSLLCPRPWLCILRNTLCAISLKSISKKHRRTFLDLVVPAINSKRHEIVVEDSMYELRINEGVSGKSIPAERYEVLRKIANGTIDAMDELDLCTRYLLQRVAEVLSFAEAVEQGEVASHVER